MITIEDFQKVDIRVGRVIEVEDAETRKPMFKLKVDFGDFGIKQAIAGIKGYYEKEEILNKKFIFVVNLETKKIGNVLSECMILAAVQEVDGNEKIVLLELGKDIEVGTRVY